MRAPYSVVVFASILVACGDSASTPAPDATAHTDATLDAPTDSPSAQKDDDVIVVPTDAAPVGDPRGFDVRQRGPFGTGYRLLMHTYTPRGSTTPRTIPVHVWYPTRAIRGPHPTYGRFFADPEAITDAPLAPSVHPRGYPVQVYSHGDRGFGGTSHFLMRYFASHGWVSVAPDHVGNTLFDTPDPRPFTLYHLRSQDVRAALDLVEGLPASDPLSGRCDTRRVVLTGHSFGTHTVWASVGATFDVDAFRAMCTPRLSCGESDLTVFREGIGDPRIVAAIPMAGSINRTLFGAMGHGAVRIPMLAMSGSEDPVGADGQFASTAPMPLTWIDVRGGCHQYFALGGCTMIPDALQGVIVGAWSMAFARRHVLDDSDPTVLGVLDGTLALSDRVTLHRRP